MNAITIQDIVLEKFTYADIRAFNGTCICIYRNPADYPGKYVARLWVLTRATCMVCLANTLDDIRKCVPSGLTLFRRSEKDDPCIEEIWL